MRTLRIAVVTNIPTPYRNGVYESLGNMPGIELCVFYCAEREPNRHWLSSSRGYRSVLLRTFALQARGQYIHFGMRVWRELTAWAPDVVFTSGYGPVMLQALAWCRLRHKPHVAFTDGTPATEASLTFVHRWVRRLVFARSAAFVGASRKSLAVFHGFGAPAERTFQSCLCVDNGAYAPIPGEEKRYDVMFAGQLIPRKMPLFFLEVVRELSRRLARCRAVLVGAGPLDQDLRHWLRSGPQNLEVTMPGFVQPQDIPSYYRQSRLFLFPSREDAWGVVANEAAAAGLPIITTPETGVVGELVQHGVNGFVLAPEAESWATAAQQLLETPADYERMARASLEIASVFTRANAAMGIRDAALCAVAEQD